MQKDSIFTFLYEIIFLKKSLFLDELFSQRAMKKVIFILFWYKNIHFFIRVSILCSQMNAIISKNTRTSII